MFDGVSSSSTQVGVSGRGALRAVVVPAAVSATAAAAPVARNVRREGVSCSGMFELRWLQPAAGGLGWTSGWTLASKRSRFQVTVRTKKTRQNSTWVSLSGFAMS